MTVFPRSVGTFLMSRSEISLKEAAVSSMRSEEHTSELQSPCNLVCRLLLEKKKCDSAGSRVLPSRAFYLVNWGAYAIRHGRRSSRTEMPRLHGSGSANIRRSAADQCRYPHA